MPIFEFTDGAGFVTDIYLPLGKIVDEIEEDGRKLKRVRVPSRISTPRIVQSEHQASQVLKGYRALEDAGKLPKSEFTPDQVKAAWEMPDNEG